MKQTQITKCPKCDTTFRVSPAQLKVAKGAVRCGACLHVFRASEHFQTNKQPEPVVQDDRTQDLFAGEHSSTDSASPSALESDDSVTSTSDDMTSEDPLKNTAASQQPETGTLDVDEFDLGQPLEEDDFLIDDNNGLEDDDEFGLINDDMDEDHTPVISEINEDFLSIDVETEADPFYTESDKLIDTVKSEDSADDESWAESLLEDSPEPQETPTSQPQKVLKPAPTKPSFTYIETDPLDLSLPKKTSRRQLWVLGGAAFLLFMTFVGQLAFFNFDQWARIDQYRPYYALACEQIGCVLPSTYNVNEIRTTATPQVSTHPKFKGALSVDVLFMNHASYEQAFPKLALTFTDQNDNVIAHRLFSPQEYLAGEASGLTMMPVATPIHIALDIQDPGPKANNYQVRFVAP